MSVRGLTVVLIVLGFARVAAAQDETPPASEPAPAPTPPPAPPDPLRVSVMTMGPGDHPFFRFGHNAIVIEDTAAGTARVYNFGTFKFDSPRLIFDFLGGRLNYWLSVSPLPRVIADYKRENRSITLQELELSPAEKAELQEKLEINARPENRLYKYDYFLDNCSTRVRDAIDKVTRGRLHRTAEGPGRMTLRQHALRMAAEPFWFYLALDIVLGPGVDRPIDGWTEMFLPQEVSDALGTGFQTVIPDPPLLGKVRWELFHADRPPPLQLPPARGAWFVIWGILLGFAFFALGWVGRWLRGARVAFGILAALWGLAAGFIGCFLVYAWGFTDHVVTHRNQNILLCAPWAIALCVLGVGVAMGRPGATRKAFALSAAALGAVLLACALKVGVVAHQENGVLVAFFLPVWLGVTAALLLLRYATALGTSRL